MEPAPESGEGVSSLGGDDGVAEGSEPVGAVGVAGVESEFCGEEVAETLLRAAHSAVVIPSGLVGAGFHVLKFVQPRGKFIIHSTKVGLRRALSSACIDLGAAASVSVVPECLPLSVE